MAKKINVLKFTNNKEIKFNKLPHDKGIIIDSGIEGYLADPESFIEYQSYNLFGFIKPKPEKVQGSFIVREDAPDPLRIRKNSIFGPVFTESDLIYHEDESLARSMALVEEKNSNEPDYIQKQISKLLLIEAVSVMTLVVAVGLPTILKKWGL